MRIDLRFVDLEYELWALDHLRDVIEQQVQFLKDQDHLRTFAELKEHGWDHDEAEWQLATQELDERQEIVIPRFFRGPFVVSLWACYESGIREVADYLQRTKKVVLNMRDIRAENELAQAQKYFSHVLAFSLDDSSDRLAFLADLKLVRNALAHANGQKRAMSPEQWTRVSKALARHGAPVDDYRGFIIITCEFAKKAFEAVHASLHQLVTRARAV
jgi:hypothetical protein